MYYIMESHNSLIAICTTLFFRPLLKNDALKVNESISLQLQGLYEPEFWCHLVSTPVKSFQMFRMFVSGSRLNDIYLDIFCFRCWSAEFS